jgi:hypothetical protein
VVAKIRVFIICSVAEILERGKSLGSFLKNSFWQPIRGNQTRFSENSARRELGELLATEVCRGVPGEAGEAAVEL